MSSLKGNQFAKGNPPNKTSFKKGNIPWNKNQIKIYCEFCNKEIYPRRRLAQKYCSDKCKDLGSKRRRNSQKTEFKKGYIPWNKGLKGKYRLWPDGRKDMLGEKSPFWQGGISFEPYGVSFNNELKGKIRKRDKYRCQECFRCQDELFTKAGKKYKLIVHHIDYNKQNNKPSNLISLCRSCHSQTNFRREDWTKYFSKKLKR